MERLRFVGNYLVLVIVSLFFSISAFGAYDSSFSVDTKKGYTVKYDKQQNLFYIFNSEGDTVLSGTPKYKENELHGLGGATDRLFIFEVFGESSSAEFTIFRYYGEANVPRYTRKARLKINDNGKKSTSWVGQLQDFMPEQDRLRFKSFGAQTTNGGWISYDEASRVMQIVNANGNITHYGYAYLEETTLVAGLSNNPAEYFKTFTFKNNISGEPMKVVLGLGARRGELRTATISEVTPGWYRQNKKVTTFFNLEYGDNYQGPSSGSPALTCKSILN